MLYIIIASDFMPLHILYQMRKLRHFFVFLIIFLPACQSSHPWIAPEYSTWTLNKPTPQDSVVFTTFLVGDAGNPRSEIVFNTLKPQLDETPKNSFIAFLGDNIYCCGLPDSANTERLGAEDRIDRQLNILTDFKGKIAFVPGNHDWDRMREDGLNAIHREENYIETYLNRGNTFLPDSGRSGPAEIQLTNDITLLAIDTQWSLHEGEKMDEEADFFAQLDSAIQRNQKKLVIVIGHHPVFSNGSHGGYFPLRSHIFPLTDIWDWAYVPLPIIGSIIPLTRKYIGHSTDLTHKNYRRFKDKLQKSFNHHNRLIYAAGHEHTLQYFNVEGVRYLVSGAGSKETWTAGGHSASFTSSSLGFMIMQHYQSGAVWLEVWQTPENDDAYIAFKVQLFEGNRPFQVEETTVLENDNE